MSAYGDDDDEEYGEWICVEDYWDEANDLAEHTCPSPMPYAEFEFEEYDVHDYWQDIEYISDGGYYEDHQGPAKRKITSDSSSRPKKRRMQNISSEQPAPAEIGPVSWMSQQQRYETQRDAPLVTTAVSRSTALLKDWDRRFKDTPGLASFPKSDFHMEEDFEEQPVSGDGFDLHDLQSVAGLLTEEHIGTLQKILEAKGMDAAAVQEVLQDLIEGKERSLDGDIEDEENADEGDQAEETEHGLESQSHTSVRGQNGKEPVGDGDALQTGREPATSLETNTSLQTLGNHQQPGYPRPSSKRKGIPEDGGIGDSEGGTSTRRTKKLRAKRHDPGNGEDINVSSLHISHDISQASESDPPISPGDAPRTRSGRARRR